MKSAKELLKMLRTTDECTTIEAKECTEKIDKSVMETICAYANEPDLGGGYILLGIHVDDTKVGPDRYEVVGIDDPDKIQSDLATQCSTMFNRRVSIHSNPEKVDGKTVVVVYVPEGEKENKPYYIESKGLPKGAYRRIAGTDQQCGDDDMPLLYAKSDDFDKGIIEDASLDDIDENALARYRALRAEVNPHAEELTYNDRDLLLSLGCIKKNKDGEWRLTNTGLLVFGTPMALRRIMPMVRVDYIRIPGTEWVEDPDRRFETIDMRGPMILLVPRIYNAIVDDLPRSFALKDGEIQSSTKSTIPEKALREGIVNGLIHRTFRVNQPIQVIRYSNRIEIINPGYSLKPEESLGEPGSVLRNPMISAIFHETNLAETKGSGLKAMRLLFSKAGLLPPTYESDHGKNRFVLRMLLHHLFDNHDMTWLGDFDSYGLSEDQKTALVFLREVGAIDVLTYRQLTGLKTSGAKSDLGKLINVGLIVSKGKGNRIYYVPSDNARELFSKAEPIKAKGRTPDAEKAEPIKAKGRTHDSEKAEPLSTKGRTPDDENGLLFNGNLPVSLKDKLLKLKKKESIVYLQNLVEELCSYSPLSVEEISSIINRKVHYTWREIIKPLKIDGKISFTHPEMINHPEQKYKIGLNSRFYSEKQD